MAAEQQKFISYLRVSTQKQGRSGLGLEAQREAVRRLIADRGGVLLAEYVEVETGKRNDRPKLDEALKRCRMAGATLAIAKLDRLSRNAAFLLALRDAGADFIAADAPHASPLTIGVLALMAEEERKAISTRTKDALAAAKARGTKLGGFRARAPRIASFSKQGADALQQSAVAWAEEWREVLGELRGQGLSFAAMADQLNADGMVSRRGGAWSAATVHRTVQRLGL